MNLDSIPNFVRQLLVLLVKRYEFFYNRYYIVELCFIAGKNKRFYRPWNLSRDSIRREKVSICLVQFHLTNKCVYRNGWSPRYTTKTEPMSAIAPVQYSRSDYYINGDITSRGISVLKSSERANYPGPGQYSPSLVESYDARKSMTLRRSFSSTGRSVSTGRPQMDSGSPRMAPPAAVIKNGILFTSTERNQNIIGPGYYSPQVGGSLKKSYNVRVSDGNKSGIFKADTFLHSPTKGGRRPTSAHAHPTVAAQAQAQAPFSPRGKPSPFSPSLHQHGNILQTPKREYSPALGVKR